MAVKVFPSKHWKRSVRLAVLGRVAVFLHAAAVKLQPFATDHPPKQTTIPIRAVHRTKPLAQTAPTTVTEDPASSRGIIPQLAIQQRHRKPAAAQLSLRGGMNRLGLAVMLLAAALLLMGDISWWRWLVYAAGFFAVTAIKGDRNGLVN